ncbi:MAG: CheR family methyltransferase [Bacteroidota bacterium]
MITLSQEDFKKLSVYVYQECGINLTPPKHALVQGRLQKRLQSLNMKSFLEYYRYVKGPKGHDEIVRLLDAVSTNKTDFFRENTHFKFISGEVLPEFKSLNENKSFNIWSAACSSGEEPYTMAMVMEEFIRLNGPLDYHIQACDISTQALKRGVSAVYRDDHIQDVPMELRKRYLLKSKDTEKRLVRVGSKLRTRVNFFRMNLMKESYTQEIKSLQDIIFCRNVLIYFDRDTQYAVVSKLLQRLKPGGYLLIGHSESLFKMDLPLKQIMPATYQKTL